MTDRNWDLRKLAQDNGVFLWKVAEQLGINDGNFSRLLRKQLTETKKREIREIILKLAKSNTKN